MCGVYCTCEWLGETKIPVHNCCGTVSNGCFIINGYCSFCKEPNEHKCRNCMLCAVPFMLAATWSIVPFLCELTCIPVCTGCGYASGHPCTCYKYIDDIESTGCPNMNSLEPIAQSMKSQN